MHFDCTHSQTGGVYDGVKMLARNKCTAWLGSRKSFWLYNAYCVVCQCRDHARRVFGFFALTVYGNYCIKCEQLLFLNAKADGAVVFFRNRSHTGPRFNYWLVCISNVTFIELIRLINFNAHYKPISQCLYLLHQPTPPALIHIIFKSPHQNLNKKSIILLLPFPQSLHWLMATNTCNILYLTNYQVFR